MQLRFVPKPDRDSTPLREGRVDLETGVIGSTTGPELRAQALFAERFIGAVRAGHSLAPGKLTVQRYAGGRHIAISRGGTGAGPVDEALAARGLSRELSVAVAGFSEALAIARASDLIATVPARHTAHLREGLFSFELPLALQAFKVSLLWHPRMDGDAAHRWLRGCVREVCAGSPVLRGADDSDA